MQKTVILDMDGTMFDTEPLWEKAFIITGKELGYSFTRELHDKTISSNSAGLSKILLNELGDSFPIEEFLRKYVENMNKVVEEDGLPIKPGLLELLDYLKENGYTIAIASSSDKIRIKSNLKLNNIDESIFKVIVSGEHFTKGKPDPEVYIKACELLNANPQEVIAIEDSNNGIKAAYSAGCIPILIPDVDKITNETKEMAKYQFNTLDEVIDVLK